ncbi:hypothetical protein D3C81_1521820 [compost metagenome]
MAYSLLGGCGQMPVLGQPFPFLRIYTGKLIVLAKRQLSGGAVDKPALHLSFFTIDFKGLVPQRHRIERMEQPIQLSGTFQIQTICDDKISAVKKVYFPYIPLDIGHILPVGFRCIHLRVADSGHTMRLQHLAAGCHVLRLVCAGILAFSVNKNYVLGAGLPAPPHMHRTVECDVMAAFDSQRLAEGMQQERVLIPMAMAHGAVTAALGKHHDMFLRIFHSMMHGDPSNILKPFQRLCSYRWL